YYYGGENSKSLELVLYNLGDKKIIDNHINSFTASERENHLKLLERCIIPSNGSRYQDGTVNSDYLPSKDAFCLMDLLELLAKGDNFYLPLDSKDYNRIGLKTTDEFNLFEKTEDVPSAFSNLVFNSKHMNISIRYMIKGKVKLNPIEAKKNDLEKVIDSQIYR